MFIVASTGIVPSLLFNFHTCRTNGVDEYTLLYALGVGIDASDWQTDFQTTTDTNPIPFEVLEAILVKCQYQVYGSKQIFTRAFGNRAVTPQVFRQLMMDGRWWYKGSGKEHTAFQTILLEEQPILRRQEGQEESQSGFKAWPCIFQPRSYSFWNQFDWCLGKVQVLLERFPILEIRMAILRHAILSSQKLNVIVYIMEQVSSDCSRNDKPEIHLGEKSYQNKVVGNGSIDMRKLLIRNINGPFTLLQMLVAYIRYDVVQYIIHQKNSPVQKGDVDRCIY